MKRFVFVVVAAALLAPAADAGRYAVGVRTIADLPRLRAALPNAESLAPIPALVVDQAAPPRLADLPGATYVERLRSRRLAFVPNDPLAAKQWHLNATRAFDFWDSSALALALPPVRVAIIDSGIDATHPDLADKIVEAKSFVGGSASVDHEGHGTFVAGLIAAAVDNSPAFAGMAPSAELLIAKVVVGGDVIDVEAEANAIKLGGAQRRTGDQPQPRRASRPARPRPRHVLAARGGCCRLRLREGSRGRRSGRERRTGSHPAMAVRELPGRPAARPGRQRACARRLRSLVLEPRQDLQRHRGARGRNRLDHAARDDGALQGCSIRASRAVAPTSGARARGLPLLLRRCRLPPRSSSPSVRTCIPSR